MEYNKDFCLEKHKHIDAQLEHHEERIAKLEDIVYNIRSLIITLKWLTGVLLTAVISIVTYIIQTALTK
jgi:hypothetical protein